MSESDHDGKEGQPETPEQAVARRAEAKKELARDLVAFVGTVMAVALFDWTAKDVIWGLWICSLTFGYTFIVLTIFAPAVRVGGGAGALMAVGGLFLLAFFTFHFGMFHFVHGQFLNAMFPLSGSGRGFLNPFFMVGAAISSYWPLVVATFISRFTDLPLKSEKSIFDKDPMKAVKGADPFIKPYANVIRMHLLIFVFAGLHAAKMSDYAIYPVLLFYFFPWRAFFGKKAALVEAAD